MSICEKPLLLSAIGGGCSSDGGGGGYSSVDRPGFMASEEEYRQVACGTLAEDSGTYGREMVNSLCSPFS